MSDFTTLLDIGDWPGPINAGTGCLSCVTHCLRGRAHYFERDGESYTNCTDGGWVTESITSSGSLNVSYGILQYTCGGTEPVDASLIITTLSAAEANAADFDPGDDCGNDNPGVGPAIVRTETVEVEDCRRTTTITFGGTGSAAFFDRTSVDGVCNSGFCPGVREGRTYNILATGSFSHVRIERRGSSACQTQDEAGAEVDAAMDDTSIWGVGKDAQFPQLGCYGLGLGEGSGDPRSPDYNPLPNPSSALYRHDRAGREVLRARLAVSADAFPGQGYVLAWDEVVRSLGYDIARSGSARGKTTTTRARTYTLTDLMSAPDDAQGSLASGHASWALFGDALITIPAPGESPSAGYLAASFTRRSKIRWATRRAGVFTIRVRRDEVLNTDPGDVTTTYATLATSGTLGADGLNATAAVEFAPADHLHSVYLSVEWARDAEGAAVAYLSVGVVRDGWWGHRQLDHPVLQAASAHYRFKRFEQVSTAASEYIPEDPEDPDPCLATFEAEWLDFTQTQRWVQALGPGGAFAPWALESAAGSGNGGVSWTGEASLFDPPEFSGLSTSPGTTTWTEEEDDTPADPTSAGAIWAAWDRVAVTSNPAFGGRVISMTRRTGSTTPSTYADAEVEEGDQIYLYAPEPGQSVQLANVHVTPA